MLTDESGATTKVKTPAETFSTKGTAKGAGKHGIEGSKMFHAVKLDEACFKLKLEQSAI